MWTPKKTSPPVHLHDEETKFFYINVEKKFYINVEKFGFFIMQAFLRPGCAELGEEENNTPFNLGGPMGRPVDCYTSKDVDTEKDLTNLTKMLNNLVSSSCRLFLDQGVLS